MASRSETNNGDDADMVEVVVTPSLETRPNDVAPLTSDRCIYRVPRPLREVKPEAYTPQLVSIGPFHRGTPRLQPMEVHKLRYLQDFLKRDTEKKMEFYIEKLRGWEKRARQHYDEHICLTSDEFVEMLLIDGCFIIEFMLRYTGVVGPRDETDFLFTADSMESHLKNDMLLLENQLPFFIIERLYDLLNNRLDGQRHYCLCFLGLTTDRFLSGALRVGQDDFLTKVLTKDPSYKVKHFVDLIRQSYVLSCGRESPKDNQKFKFIPSATELHDAGVKFQTGSEKCFLFNKISGVFSIPPLCIGDDTEPLFRNLMALDFFHKYKDNYVTDYILLMDKLINTSQDVALLRKKGIIDNWLGDDEEVSSVFNKLCTGVYADPATFYYACLCGEVNAYYGIPWHFWRAKLKRDYFSTPWSAISFVAAVILLICTIAQTVSSLKN